MMLAQHKFSLDHRQLKDTLLSPPRNLLLIQDLDGVCMGLVRDPLTRTLSAEYIHAAASLHPHFFVLTNGEHIGPLGVNSLVEKALSGKTDVRQDGLLLPGLAGGGVQWQDHRGNVAHPGVSSQELEFLATVPEQMKQALVERLSLEPFNLMPEQIGRALEVAILKNPVSPTININGFVSELGTNWPYFAQLQQELQTLLETLLADAERQGLVNSFFIHYAPNLGSGPDGERIKWATADNIGSTDFQFMLKGAIKEVGVLVILNRYYHQQTGHYPLGEEFNARQAPRDHDALQELASTHFDPELMPRIIGVGDTLTSQHSPDSDAIWLRGGSDRGFLNLVQELGRRFETDNAVLFVDSSGGELQRPQIDTDSLQSDPWQSLTGITDPYDPLCLNFLFPGGHEQYVAWFCALAKAWKD